MVEHAVLCLATRWSFLFAFLPRSIAKEGVSCDGVRLLSSQLSMVDRCISMSLISCQKTWSDRFFESQSRCEDLQ